MFNGSPVGFFVNLKTRQERESQQQRHSQAKCQDCAKIFDGEFSTSDIPRIYPVCGADAICNEVASRGCGSERFFQITKITG